MEEKNAQEVAKVLGWEVPQVYREAYKLSNLLKQKYRRLGGF